MMLKRMGSFFNSHQPTSLLYSATRTWESFHTILDSVSAGRMENAHSIHHRQLSHRRHEFKPVAGLGLWPRIHVRRQGTVVTHVGKEWIGSTRFLYDTDTTNGQDQYNRFSDVKHRRNSLEIDVFTEALSTKRTPFLPSKRRWTSSHFPALVHPPAGESTEKESAR
jgi:hypothetical protein